MKTLEKILENAELALKNDDVPAARAALLKAWKAERSVGIADLIGLLDARQKDEVASALENVVAARVDLTVKRFKEISGRLRRPHLVRTSIHRFGVPPDLTAFSVGCRP